MNYLSELRESRLITESKQIYFHGTSSGLAKRILSQGFIPNPKKKVWDPARGRLSAYYGTYFSKNFGTASQAGGNAAERFGGYKVIFEAQLETRTGFMDEDELPSLAGSIDSGAGRSLMNNITALKRYAETPEQQKELAKGGFKPWLERFKIKAQESNTEVSDRYISHIYPFVMAALRAAVRNALAGNTSFDKQEIPDLKQAKKKLMQVIGSKLLHNPDRSWGSSVHNIRIEQPVTFRGANKIISAILDPRGIWVNDRYEENHEYTRKSGEPYQVIVLYGSPSSAMKEGVRAAWSNDAVFVKGSLSKFT